MSILYMPTSARKKVGHSVHVLVIQTEERDNSLSEKRFRGILLSTHVRKSGTVGKYGIQFDFHHYTTKSK